MSYSDKFSRRPYTGSCHCGNIKFIAYLPLPDLPYPKTTQTEFREASGLRIYKCNCTFCHKAGILHVRPPEPSTDFIVISPTEPFAEGSGFQSYIHDKATTSWHFCGNCGTRPFAFRGTGSTVEMDVPTALLQRANSRTGDGTPGEITAKDGETTRITVWRPNKEPLEEGETEDNTLSINGVCIDAHNDNWDLRQLHENGYISYMQTLQEVGYDYADTPYFGGAY